MSDEEEVPERLLYNGKLIEDVEMPPSANAISYLEERVKEKLPDDYRNFLLTCNGGYSQFLFRAKRAPWGIKHYFEMQKLYSLPEPPLRNPYAPNADIEYESESLLSVLQEYQKENLIPKTGFLPIATDCGGRGGVSVFLDLRGGSNHVLAFLPRFHESLNSRSQVTFSPIASSFTDFWNMLCLSRKLVRMIIKHTVPDDDIDYIIAMFDSGMPQWRDSYGMQFQRKFGRTNLSSDFFARKS